MKIIVLVIASALLTACGPKVVGHVTDELKVEFNDGVVGACAFDNQPIAGDRVTFNPDGTCHDEGKK